MNSIVKNHSPGHFIGYFFAMLCALLLVACGGGGGSAGTIPNQPDTTPTQTVASLVVTTSSSTLSSSGVPGSEVTVTVLARDKNNNAVSGATITLAANSGALTFVVPTGSTALPGVTDSTGTVTAKLSTAGVTTPRDISIVAKSGTVTSSTSTVHVVSSNASLTLITSSAQLPSSGKVNVTLFAKDGSNNAIRGAKVSLTADTGLLTVTGDGTTSATDGTLTAVLSTPGNATPRNITITAKLDAASGIADPATKIVQVVTAVPSLQITASNGTLPSSGAAGTEVTINVLVRDAGNNAKADVPVTLTTDSGSLTSNTNRISNAQGLVTEKLSVAGNPANRIITVKAVADGVDPVQVLVNVSGTKLTVDSTTSVNAGEVSDMTATLTDSSATPLVSRAITLTTSNGGTVTAENNGVTDISGRVKLHYTPPATGTTDTVTAAALGTSGFATFVINRANFKVTTPLDPVTGKPLNGLIKTCYPVSIHSDNSGTATTGSVSLSISRGAIYSDAACGVPQVALLSFDGSGNASAFFKSDTPGTAALVATLPTNISVQGAFKFTAPLTPTANIIMSVDPSVIGINGAQAAVQAVVRDGTAGNNLVSGATVNFTVVQDNSGGSLSSPSVIVTGDDGVAKVNYISGPSSTATNGVIVQAQIQGTNITKTIPLTVGKRSLFLTAGTGNTLGTPTTTSYQIDYQVLATDAAGNAVPGANITASVLPTRYGKGTMILGGTSWIVSPTAITCANEDLNTNGFLDAGEDNNGNGILDPGIPIAVTPTVQTDANGVATVSLIYARNQANWLTTKLTITGTVAGTETKYFTTFVLPALASDLNKADVAPPGRFSPYGTAVGVDPLDPTRAGCTSSN